MQVDEHKALRLEKDGKTYFFCSQHCKDSFLTNGKLSTSGHLNHHSHMVSDFKKRFLLSLLASIPVIIVSAIIPKFILSSLVFFYGGWPFLKGLFDELKNRQPGMMTLIALAISAAYIYSAAVVFGLSGTIFFWELVTLIDIMLLGHWIEMKSVMGASRALEGLVKLLPSGAHKLLSDGKMEDVPLEQLQVNDRVIVKPAEKIPADGKILEGESSINEAALTGESTPVLKTKGDEVIGGSINQEGSLTVAVKKTGADSFIFRIVSLVQEAQQTKSRSQDLANRAALWLTVIALTCGALTFLIWLVFVHKDFAFALERAVTVMVITCPHALGLAVPLVVSVSTALAAANGLLIRNRAAFEKARNIQVIIFDKTGTLTEGKFAVTDVIGLAKDINKNELLKYAASLESRSEHLIAKGIASSVKEFFTVEEFKAITGKGAQAKVNGRLVKVVNRGYLGENNIVIDDQKIKLLTSQGKTVVFVLIDGDLKGIVALADMIRPESKKAISMLKDMGIKCMMLTGDNKEVAQQVSRELGITDYFAEVLPLDKANKVKEVQSRGLIVAMVGDGVNDAPAIAEADVGIAIGAGTDVAVETADIILVKNNPQNVVAIVGLARATYKKIAQNLVWATGYNTLAIPLAAGILYNLGVVLSPAVGALLMSLSTIIVAINARSLQRKKLFYGTGKYTLAEYR